MSIALIDVSIVLVSWNTRDLLLACLKSLPDAIGVLRADVWVVDNGSADESVAATRAWHASAAELPVYNENTQNVQLRRRS